MYVLIFLTLNAIINMSDCIDEQNKTKQNKQNKTKQNKTKQNKTKQIFILPKLFTQVFFVAQQIYKHKS